jgi:hypothetical protein
MEAEGQLETVIWLWDLSAAERGRKMEGLQPQNVFYLCIDSRELEQATAGMYKLGFAKN